MPVRPYKIREFRECEDAMTLVVMSDFVSGTGGFSLSGLWQHDDKPLVDNDLEELLILYTGEVLTRVLRTNVGPQRLSIAYLRAREQALGDAVSRTQEAEYRMSVDNLERQIIAWQVRAALRAWPFALLELTRVLQPEIHLTLLAPHGRCLMV